MKMFVYGKRGNTPIVVETNLAYAIPYWTARKLQNPKLFWTFA